MNAIYLGGLSSGDPVLVTASSGGIVRTKVTPLDRGSTLLLFCNKEEAGHKKLHITFAHKGQ